MIRLMRRLLSGLLAIALASAPGAALPLGGSAPAGGGVVTTFQLTSPNPGTQPFTIGIPVKDGAVPGGAVTLNTTSSQCVTMRLWNDGSVKHVLCSGTQTLAANVAKTITVSAGTSAGGAPLTCASITAAAPSVSVNLGVNGIINLSSLLGSPVRTFLSGPEMVECHYQTVTATNHLFVAFHVRLWKGGRVWVRGVVENGWLDLTAADQQYTAAVTIGGATAFSTTFGASNPHYAHTRWMADAWIGGDPQVTPTFNVADIIKTKMVPNYYGDTPPPASLNGLYQAYIPYDTARLPDESGDITSQMGNPGNNPQIGLLPIQDAMFATSLGDVRAYNAVLSDAKAINNFPIVWRGSADNSLPVRPSVFPTWGVSGPFSGGLGIQQPTAGPLTWDSAHHPSSGFLAYLLTGDYVYFEDMELTSSLLWLALGQGRGNGTSRLIANSQDAVRMPAWLQRSVGQLTAIAPTPFDLVVTDMQAFLANGIANEVSITTTPGINHLGVIDEFDIYFPTASTVLSPTFMHHFWVQTFGYLHDLEPLPATTMPNLVTVEMWLDRIAVGMFGDGTGTTWCFSYVGNQFRINNAAPSPVSQTTDLTGLYDNWNLVWVNTYPATSCPNTLQGPIDNTTGQWATPEPGLAYAVDHGAPGAAAAYARFLGATNYAEFRNPIGGDSYAISPVFGLNPR